MAGRWRTPRAWLAARRQRREDRRNTRIDGTCPDCGIYLAAHRGWPRHGAAPTYRPPVTVFRDGQWQDF